VNSLPEADTLRRAANSLDTIADEAIRVVRHDQPSPEHPYIPGGAVDRSYTLGVRAVIGGPPGYLAGMFSPHAAKQTAALFRREAEQCAGPETCPTFLALLALSRALFGILDLEEDV
jgi:hypothetical protein